MGSDTGGSIRIPAALCGVVGLKATYGLVPLTGIVPLYPTQDHSGPLTRTVADAALVLSTIAGFDGGDPSSVRRPRRRYEASLGTGVAGLRIGLVQRHREGVDDEVLAAVDGAASVLEKLGARLVDVTWPEGTFPTTRAMAAEGGATHAAAFAADPDGFGPAARRSMERALEVKAVDYL
jgi:aspartyl-tRNA(Asn)/glutamyl-tRNA(Gln) amidotransferase subunit A